MEFLDDDDLLEPIDELNEEEMDLENLEELDLSDFDDLLAPLDEDDTDYSDDNIFYEESIDTADKILQLSDALSEEIIIDNIQQQLENGVETEENPTNYYKLFMQKYAEMTEDNPLYDKAYIYEVVQRVSTLVLDGIRQKFGVELGTDLEYSEINEYMKKVNAMWEFIFLRQSRNVKDYLFKKIKTMKQSDLDDYEKMVENSQFESDIFLNIDKKKFKKPSDAIVINFITNMINDIRNETDSGYSLFSEITSYDMFEETNFEINLMLFDYGNDLVFNEDKRTAEEYMSILDNEEAKVEIRNYVLMKFLEEAELSDK